MERLAGSDAGFLFIETETQTSSCIDLAELAPSAEPITLDDLHRHVAARLHVLPSFRWRLEPVPLGINHALWIEDPDFDLAYHLRHDTLPAPGGPAELDAYITAVLPARLDRRHPLWRIRLVDGLGDHRQALVFQFHHAIADGTALITTLDRLFGPVPEGEPPPWEPEHPRRSRVFVDAARDQAKAWAGIPKLAKLTVQRFKAVDARRAEGVAPVPPITGGAPATALNDSFSADRTYARTRFAVADLQRIKAEAGTTLNDGVLALVASALRSYLLERDALPAAPLVVNVPVANEAPGSAPRQHGNRFANFFASLATDVEDPWERLAAIGASTAEAKLQLDIQGRDTLPRWLDRLPPALAMPGARALTKHNLKDPTTADFSVLVSNVRMGERDRSVCGVPVDRMYMSGPIADGAGLNITITGHGAHLNVAVVANPAAVDPHELVDRMRSALDELLATRPSVVAGGAPSTA